MDKDIIFKYFTLFSFIAFFVSWLFYLKTTVCVYFDKQYEKGAIVEKSYNHVDTRYYYTIEMSVKSQKILFRSQKETWREYNIGDSLLVVFPKHKPQQAMIAISQTNFFLYVILIFFIFLGLGYLNYFLFQEEINEIKNYVIHKSSSL